GRPDADVDVDAPDDHLAAPPLGAVDDLRVGRLLADALPGAAGEGVRSGGPHVDAEFAGGVADHAELFAEVFHGLGDGVADAGDQFDGVGQEFALDPVAGVVAGDDVERFGGARHQFAGVAVDECDLPLDAQRVSG